MAAAKPQPTCEVEGCKYTGETQAGFCPEHTIAEWKRAEGIACEAIQALQPRPIAEIIANLSKPVATRHLKQKTKGGKQLDFLPWYNAIKYLDLYAPGWCYEIRSITPIGNQAAVVARITIPTAEGACWREATGIEDDEVKGYGDTTSNAESMALRRAAAKFGLGLYLYNK